MDSTNRAVPKIIGIEFSAGKGKSLYYILMKIVKKFAESSEKDIRETIKYLLDSENSEYLDERMKMDFLESEYDEFVLYNKLLNLDSNGRIVQINYPSETDDYVSYIPGHGILTNGQKPTDKESFYREYARDFSIRKEIINMSLAFLPQRIISLLKNLGVYDYSDEDDEDVINIMIDRHFKPNLNLSTTRLIYDRVSRGEYPSLYLMSMGNCSENFDMDGAATDDSEEEIPRMIDLLDQTDMNMRLLICIRHSNVWFRWLYGMNDELPSTYSSYISNRLESIKAKYGKELVQKKYGDYIMSRNVELFASLFVKNILAIDQNMTEIYFVRKNSEQYTFIKNMGGMSFDGYEQEIQNAFMRLHDDKVRLQNDLLYLSGLSSTTNGYAGSLILPRYSCFLRVFNELPYSFHDRYDKIYGSVLTKIVEEKNIKFAGNDRDIVTAFEKFKNGKVDFGQYYKQRGYDFEINKNHIFNNENDDEKDMGLYKRGNLIMDQYELDMA